MQCTTEITKQIGTAIITFSQRWPNVWEKGVLIWQKQRILPHHKWIGELFVLNNTFIDDLLVFDATFMDELVSLSGEQGVCFTKATRPFFVFQVEIYAKNTKKTRKKHEIFTHIY